MNTSITNLPVDHAEQGHIDLQAQILLEIYRENSGELNHNWQQVLPHLIHFSNPLDNYGLTRPLTIGSASYLVSVYGRDWTLTPPSARSPVDEKLLENVSTQYAHAAHSLQPRLDLLNTPIRLPESKMRQVNYFRLILPLKLKTGITTLFSYSSATLQ